MNYSQLRKMVLLIEKGPDDFSDELTVLFNPNQILLNKTTEWKTHPTAASDSGNTRVSVSEPVNLNVDLFFDTFEQQKDVREYTRRLYNLTTIEKQINITRPPLCRIIWGDFNLSDEYSCEWALERLDQKFTLFLGSGLPVRATLTCSFKQWRDPKLEAAILNVNSQTNTSVDTIQENQTLANFSHKTLGDARRWPEIARENNITAPRQIEPGRRLSVNLSNEAGPQQTRALKASSRTQSALKVTSKKIESPNVSGPSRPSFSGPRNGAGGGRAKPTR